MKTPKGLLPLCCAIVLGATTRASAEPEQTSAEIVVAMRYLQPNGTSHSHLYLYREDGKFLRQLTDDNTGQDRDPVFAPDGGTFVFARQMKADRLDYFSMQLHSGKLRHLPAAPDWYAATAPTPSFGSLDEDISGLFTREWTDQGVKSVEPPAEAPRFRSPDGSVELVLKILPTNEDDEFNFLGHGRSYEFHDLAQDTIITFGAMPGFVGATNLLALARDPARRFLLSPPLRVAFFSVHQGSTERDACIALDINRRRLVQLSPNWAEPVPLPNEPAFLTWTEVLHVPFGDGNRTANCSYIEHWDTDLRCIRYARPKAAGICYGASMYRPGKTPAVIQINGDNP